MLETYAKTHMLILINVTEAVAKLAHKNFWGVQTQEARNPKQYRGGF